jgi:UDP-2-acetamido-2-deoxy-ribo-hexuluronate aminotransferase
MREISVHGQNRRYHHPRIGINGRMDTIQAAILLAKLEVFADEVKVRAQLGEQYTAMISAKQKEAGTSAIVTPFIESWNTSVYAQYTIQVDNREQIQKRLESAQIPSAVHYPVPLNQQPALLTDEFQLAVSEALSDKVISLPMHPYLNQEQQESVVQALFSEQS